MNREKVYTAPSAEMLLLVPTEELAGTWGYNSWKDWTNGLIEPTQQNPASGVGVIYSDKWPEDGYKLNS